MAIELTVGAPIEESPAAAEDRRIVTFASVDALLHELDTDDSTLRCQINRS